MSDPIVGIDLGTSNSVVAHADATGAVQVLADDAGGKVHPSVVSFHPGGGVVVGAAAKQRKVIDPQNTIYSTKRLIGRSYRSPEVQTARARSPFQIKEGPNSAPVIVTRAGEFAVPEISAIVLDHVRNIAAARLGVPISRAIVTVPASFNDAQRSATATAGAIAGLTVVRVLNEPTAAALAYGHTRRLREIIAVYDFGGGTFDITLLSLEDQVYQVLGTSGDTFLGGDDLDERLVEKMAAKFLAENRIDLRTNDVAMMRLRAVAEQTKIELSRRARAVVRIDEIAHGPRGIPLNLQIEIARDEFVTEVADLVDRTFPVCREALALAQLSIDHITDVILVGGTTKVPYVRDQVARFFGKAPRTDVNPDDAVAVGAALQGSSLERILARRSSSRLAAPPPPPTTAVDEEETTASAVDVLQLVASGTASAPAELTPAAGQRPHRPTANHAGGSQRDASDVTRRETSYSVTRAGLRDAVAEPERHPASPLPMPWPSPPAEPANLEDHAPRSSHSQSQPLGRLTRPAPADPPATQNKTMLGVPAAPTAPTAPTAYDDLGPAARSRELPHPSRPITMTGTASPPPVPKPTARQRSVARGPVPASPAATPPPSSNVADPGQPQPPPAAAQAAIASPVGGPGALDWLAEDSASGTDPGAWAVNNRAATQPMTPLAPLAPPTAPTLVAMVPDHAAASTVRGIGAPAIVAEPSPAATAKGFQPPQSYLVQAVPGPPRPAPVVLEVTPRGLGIATVAGFCEELICRNSRVPAETRKVFTTARDQQDLVRIVVCQGESRRLDENTVIGDLVLQNLPRRPRGETSIEVTFSLDASGVLHVRARDSQTGVEQRATLSLVGGVAQEDVAASRNRLQQLQR